MRGQWVRNGKRAIVKPAFATLTVLVLPNPYLFSFYILCGFVMLTSARCLIMSSYSWKLTALLFQLFPRASDIILFFFLCTLVMGCYWIRIELGLGQQICERSMERSVIGGEGKSKDATYSSSSTTQQLFDFEHLTFLSSSPKYQMKGVDQMISKFLQL